MHNISGSAKIVLSMFNESCTKDGTLKKTFLLYSLHYTSNPWNCYLWLNTPPGLEKAGLTSHPPLPEVAGHFHLFVSWRNNRLLSTDLLAYTASLTFTRFGGGFAKYQPPNVKEVKKRIKVEKYHVVTVHQYKSKIRRFVGIESDNLATRNLKKVDHKKKEANHLNSDWISSSPLTDFTPKSELCTLDRAITAIPKSPVAAINDASCTGKSDLAALFKQTGAGNFVGDSRKSVSFLRFYTRRNKPINC